jgi:hypothetical protein
MFVFRWPRWLYKNPTRTLHDAWFTVEDAKRDMEDIERTFADKRLGAYTSEPMFKPIFWEYPHDDNRTQHG